MPTATATDRHAELAAAHAAARAELDETRQRAHEYRGRIHSLRAALLERSIDYPEEFGETGEPRKGSEAAKLGAEIVKLTEADSFDTAVKAAEARVERARVEERRVVEQVARDLLLESVSECERVADALVAWAAEGQELLRQYHELTHRNTSICTQSRAWDPRSVPELDHLSHLVHELAKSVPPKLPLPRGLVDELRQAEDE